MRRARARRTKPGGQRYTAPRRDRQPARDPVEREPRSRWRPGYWLRHPAIGVVFFACGALILVGCAIGVVVDQRHLRERGETATAVVAEARELRRGVRVTLRMTTPRGAVVRADLVDPPADLPEPGDRLTVRYDPADPGKAYRTDYQDSLAGPVALVALGVLPGLLYGWYLRRTWGHWRDQAEDWRHRRPVPRLGVRQDPFPHRARRS